MTVSIPPVTFPGTATGPDLTGRPPTFGLVLVMSRPAAPAPGHGSQPAPPSWPGDRSGLGCATPPPGCASWRRPRPQ